MRQSHIVLATFVGLTIIGILFVFTWQQREIKRIANELNDLRSSLDIINQKLFSLSIKEEALAHPADQSEDTSKRLSEFLNKLGSKNLIESYRAARSVKRFGKKAIPGLLDLVENGNGHARKSALAILGYFEDSTTSPSLRKFALKSKDKAIRAGSLGILAKMRDAEAEPTFVKTLEDPEQEVRHAAVVGIRRLKIHRALPKLIRLYNEERGFLAREIDRAIVSLGKEHADNFLKEIQPLTPEARFLALKIIGKNKNNDMSDLLKEMLNDPDPRVALGSARLLSERGYDEGVSFIQEFLNNDPTGELQHIAQEILNAIDSSTPP